MLGFSGILLFNSRFLIQWWEAETLKKSTLGPLFWWMSVSGGSLSIIYFAYIADPVNLIGPSLGMIPYIRNLMLIYKKRVAT
jgi:lipid-A-disaccharide synthase